ncbi:MAG: AbrB/MazE/SpoVT family DNA-binding domain-containing protein [Lachnospiraceae bacterium]|nr:AbrB/MazE/SpoVT family DNA-binding domain-containing protein [Lachnospiraceae bacterium]
METAKLFTNGGSQAVRLPKSCRFTEDEVYINRIGNIVIIIPKNDPWSHMADAIDMFTDDFLREPIPDLPIQEKEGL